MAENSDRPWFRDPWMWAALVLLAAVLVMGAVAAGWHCVIADLDASEWASWVQAVGSIAALAAGVAIVRHQHAVAARSQQAEEVRRLRLIQAAANGCKGGAELCLAANAQAGFMTTEQLEGLHQRAPSIRSIGVMDVPELETFVALANLSAELATFQAMFNKTQAPLKGNSIPSGEAFRRQLVAVDSAAEKVRLASERALTDRGVTTK